IDAIEPSTHPYLPMVVRSPQNLLHCPHSLWSARDPWRGLISPVYWLCHKASGCYNLLALNFIQRGILRHNRSTHRLVPRQIGDGIGGGLTTLHDKYGCSVARPFKWLDACHIVHLADTQRRAVRELETAEAL